MELIHTNDATALPLSRGPIAIIENHQQADGTVRIPEALRPLIGNRVYGCDDCQLVCPWNRYAVATTVADFAEVRNGLDGVRLTALFALSEEAFLRNTEGSAIRRIGYERWSRNIAVALGNAAPDAAIVAALARRAEDPSPLVREHVAWALRVQFSRAAE